MDEEMGMDEDVGMDKDKDEGMDEDEDVDKDNHSHNMAALLHTSRVRMPKTKLRAHSNRFHQRSYSNRLTLHRLHPEVHLRVRPQRPHRWKS